MHGHEISGDVVDNLWDERARNSKAIPERLNNGDGSNLNAVETEDIQLAAEPGRTERLDWYV
jgi:hypothetical protein